MRPQKSRKTRLLKRSNPKSIKDFKGSKIHRRIKENSLYGGGCFFVCMHRVPVRFCHSEPTGEESRFTELHFVLFEILRFAQDDILFAFL